MADTKQYPVSVVVRAVDKLTGPLGEMTAKLKAFSSPFEKLGKGFSGFSKATGIPRLAAAFGGAAGAVKNVGSEAATLGLRLVALGATGVFAFARILHGAVEAGDELAKFADRVGVSIDLYASLRYSAQQNDVEQEQFNGAMSKFSKALGEAKANGGPLLELLRKVSPVMAEQVKGVKTTEQGLSLMTTAFQRLPDPARRAALSTAAFGREGIQIGEWMHIGSAAIQAQQGEYLKLAGSQELFARGSSDLDNDLRKTNAAIQGLRAAALGPLLPVFGKLADRVTDFLVTNRGRLAAWADDTAKAIQRWVDSGGIDRLAAALARFADGVSDVWEKIGGLKGAAIGLGLYLGAPLIGSIAALIPAFAELGVALLSTPVGWLTVGLGALGVALISIYSEQSPLHDFFLSFKDDVDDTATGIGVLVEGVKYLVDLYKMLDAEAKKWRDNAQKPDAMFEDRFPDYLSAAANPLRNPILNPIGALGKQVSKLRVEFSGAPPGTRVQVEESPNQSIDTSVGYQMSSHG
jgi:hypothetical protein